MSLGLSSYSSLNGLGLITGSTSGYGNYGYCGGFGSKEYTQYAKETIENNYDVQTTRQLYSNMQSTETMSFAMQSQVIQNMLQTGRTDDALFEFNNMVNEMSGLSQYAGYTEQQIKTLAQNQYKNATGTALLNDITKYADGSFISGVKGSIPIVNLFTQTNSKNDLIAEVTGTKKSNFGTVTKIAGAATGGAAFGTLAVAGNAIRKGAKAGASSGALSSIGTTLQTAFKGKTGKIAIAGAAIGVACLGIKSLLDKVTGANKADTAA